MDRALYFGQLRLKVNFLICKISPKPEIAKNIRILIINFKFRMDEVGAHQNIIKWIIKSIV